MSAKKFKIGDQVMIKPGTRFSHQDSKYNPKDVIGVIVRDDGANAKLCYWIKWSSAGYNSYGDEDLVSVLDSKEIIDEC